MDSEFAVDSGAAVDQGLQWAPGCRVIPMDQGGVVSLIPESRTCPCVKAEGRLRFSSSSSNERKPGNVTELGLELHTHLGTEERG